MKSIRPTKIDLCRSEPPPQFAEEFTFSMNAGDEIVVARRPNGQEIRSESQRADKRNPRSRMIATHCLKWPEIVELSIRSKNAYDFIWRINQSGAP